MVGSVCALDRETSLANAAMATATLTRVDATPRSDVADAGRPAMRIYTSRDGLPENAIMSIARDAEGFLWIATQDGLASYNGRSWAITNLPNRTVSNFVRALLVDSSGAMWCGRENGGVARLASDTWTTFDRSTGLPADRVHCLLETSDGAKSVIWAGTQAGLAKFVDGGWTVVEPALINGASVRALISVRARDGSDALWVGTSGGLYVARNGVWTRVPAAGTQPVQALLHTPNATGEGDIWVGTETGLAICRGGAAEQFERVPESPPESVTTLAESRSVDTVRTIWMGTETSGLYRYVHGRWTHFGSKQGVPSDAIWSLLPLEGANATNTLWVGTDAGLVRVGLGGWTTYDTEMGLPGESAYGLLVTRDANDDESLWIGTRGAGLAHYEGGSWTTYTEKDGLPGNSIWALTEVVGPDGSPEVWAGTGGRGIAKYAHGRWSVFGKAQGFDGGSIRSFSVTRSAQGRPVVWAASGDDGLFRIEDGSVTKIDHESGLPVDSTFCAIETASASGAHTLWVGMQGGGLAVRRDSAWTVVDSTNGLPNNSVLSLCEVKLSDGTRSIWAGTEGGGVARLPLDSNPASPQEWSVLNEASVPALPNNTVYQIRQDASGSIYLFTNQGVARLLPRTPTADDKSEFRVVTYTTEDGLPINEFNGGASALDYRGRLWGGTVGGAVMFDPSREVAPATRKPLLFARREVTGSGKSVADGASLAHSENGLTFEFAYLTFEHADDVTYRTQLVGLDPEPSGWLPDSKKEYTTLPRGEYVFRVWARDHRGEIVGPIEAAFSVRAAPWLTLWAFVLYAVTLGFAIYGLVRLRLRTLQRRNALLEVRIAEKTSDLAATVAQLRVSERDALEAREAAIDASRAKSTFLSNMSHELRTPLNALLGFAQLMDREPDRTVDDRESLDVIQRSGEHLLGLINDILSLSKIESGRLTLNEQVFDPVRLIRSVEEMIRVRAEMKSLQLVAEVHGELPPAVVGDEGKLRQVLINLLGNAVKFTERGGVALRVRWSEGQAVFEVEDTGAGIAPDEIESLFEAFVQTQSGRRSREGTGLGLAISRSFVRHMGGDLGVRSELGRGTTFTVTVPLPQAEAAVIAESERRIVGLEPGQDAYRILVTDDKWENRVLLAKLLTSVGFEVRQAATGFEALDKWKDWSPHLIFMDLRMPDLDGGEATRRIREAERHRDDTGPRRTTKVIALTASAFEHERENVLASGCDDFLTKPFRVGSIFDALERHLGVRFLYSGGSEVETTASDVVTQKRLGVYSPATLASLGHALAIGNIAAALAVVDQNEDHDPELARELGRIIRSYSYDELLEMIEGTAQ